MHDLSTDMWLRLGTGLIWDAQALHVAATKDERSRAQCAGLGYFNA